MQVANIRCRRLVQDRVPFRGSNLYAEPRPDGAYVVFSYGEHFPLFVYKGGRWFENSDRYSVSTSKHRTQSHPHVETVKLPTDELKRLLSA